ncbi:MAG: T9SS type A sorting domain-containing protein [Bacteroidia bacterium]
MKALLQKIFFTVCVTFVIPSVSFSQNWTSVGGGANNNILYMCTDTIYNRLYASGQFSDPSCSSGACYSFAYWDSSSWHYVGDSNHFYNYVPLAYYKGKVYTANLHSPYNNTSSNYIGEFDGNNWTKTDNIAGLIRNFKVINNRLYALGTFVSIGGVPAHDIAYKDSLGWHAIDTTTWNNAGINDVAEFNGSLYICGWFQSHDGSISELAKWDGIHWSNVGGLVFTGGNGIPLSLCTYKNEVYVGGSLSWAYGDLGNGIMKWNDTTWSQLGGGVVDSFGGGGVVTNMKVINNKLIMTGGFSFANNVVPAIGIVEWDGSRFCGFGGRFRLNEDIVCFENYNNQIHVAGPTYVDTLQINYIAKWVGGSYRDSCGALTNGIQKNLYENKFSIYPNPSSNNFILMSQKEIGFITISNTLGELVLEQRSKENSLSINLSSQPPGIYFLHAQGQVLKLIKE